MSKIGWYELEEQFGDEINVVVCDRRTGEVVVFNLDSLEAHDKLIAYLDSNRQVGALPLAANAVSD